ncbi:LAFE_0E01310g1_1 [Lachancea fermentati]|uniref:Transcription initiation factor TFIID subunit 4 n=1 Tax=Lachancea fermentati TaxID=4955 RepID=A0A1G4MCT1_LACFM|nr:LAFE_0E01310g1_1 [Lachancea fermentati]
MGKSPKRSAPPEDQETSSKRIKNEETGLYGEEEPAFELGSRSVSESLEPGNTDFSTELPTPFDNMVNESESGMSLPESATPTTNLVNKSRDNDSEANITAKTEDKKKKKDQKANIQLPQQKSSVVAKRQHGGQGQQTQGQQQGTSKTQTDPDKLSDALLSAGVDIREEEALLSSTMNITKNNAQVSNNQIPSHPPLLHPLHVASFMKKVANEQNFYQDFNKTQDILGFMSAACEMFMRDIITNSLIISRHRRRSIKQNAGRRSEASRALRDLALKQKDQEERRVKRRIQMGLEKEAAEAKMETEETLHRASNATANMMIAGTKKKYSWLTAGAKNPNNSLKTVGKVSSDVAARGEIGIRYREAREEPGIVMRDLLNALENRRIGVNTALSKGYARIRD